MATLAITADWATFAEALFQLQISGVVLMCKELCPNLLTSDYSMPSAGIRLQPQMQPVNWPAKGLAHVAHHLVSQALHCRRKAKAAGHFRHQLAVFWPARLSMTCQIACTAVDSNLPL